MRRSGWLRLCLLAVLAGCFATATRDEHPAARWWKGNTHTHTLWSDGDGAPELVASWYVENGYDFLVLSDHDVLSRGERWFPVSDGERARLTPARVEQLRARFGADSVETRERDGAVEMRLVTLDELRARFERPGEFLFLEGEEISDSFEGKPIHLNAMNLAELVPKQGGASVLDTIERNFAAVRAQSARTGRPMLAHLNHPNFGWAVSVDDLTDMRGERFFEVMNGHPDVNNEGDESRRGTEAMWDHALARRILQLDPVLLYGLATDDAHHYHEARADRANVGRGWIVVRAAELSADAIIAAMNAGDFYASSGVELVDVRATDTSYEVEIAAEPGVEYTTEFVSCGSVLYATADNPARYDFHGSEVFVRARVISTKRHPNPYREGDVERAWLQPVIPRR